MASGRIMSREARPASERRWKTVKTRRRMSGLRGEAVMARSARYSASTEDLYVVAVGAAHQVGGRLHQPQGELALAEHEVQQVGGGGIRGGGSLVVVGAGFDPCQAGSFHQGAAAVFCERHSSRYNTPGERSNQPIGIF